MKRKPRIPRRFLGGGLIFVGIGAEAVSGF